jgi:hypothetical protein
LFLGKATMESGTEKGRRSSKSRLLNNVPWGEFWKQYRYTSELSYQWPKELESVLFTSQGL